MWDEKKVRIIDIAQELGVSTATVSNVLHGKTNKISDKTVRLVERKLEERGYIPNMASTLLGRNNSKIIAVVINNHKKYEGHVLEDFFISSAVNFLYDEIERAGYFMMLKKATDIMEIVQFSTIWNLEGMVLIGFCEDEYQNLRDHIRIPFVVYDGFTTDGQSRISMVKIDDFDGGRQAGRFLFERGHRSVLCIADNEICMDKDRYEGLCEGLGTRADFLKIPMETESRVAFYQTQLDFIKTHTSVFAVSDYYAIDLMGFLLRNGVRIPGDISIIGFDGSPRCLMVSPTLTSVQQDNETRAVKAVELLCRMMADPGFQDSVVVPVKLIVRESVGIISDRS